MIARTKKLILLSLAFILSSCASHQAMKDNKWYLIETDHFRIITNEDANMMKSLATDLEKFRIVVSELMGKKAPQKTLTIYAAKDSDTYKSLVGDNLGSSTNGVLHASIYEYYAAVNVKAETGTTTSELDSARQFLFHEYTHFISSYNADYSLPYWYSEGFAEFVSTMQFQDDNKFTYGTPPENRIPYLAFSKTDPSIKTLTALYANNLESLLAATPNNINPDMMPLFYAHSWAFTHMMLTTPGYPEKLKRILNRINGGIPPRTAVEGVFNVGIEAVQMKYYRYQFEEELQNYRGHYKTGFDTFNPRVTPITKTFLADNLSKYYAHTNEDPDLFHRFKSYLSQNGLLNHSSQLYGALNLAHSNRLSESFKLFSSIDRKSLSSDWLDLTYTELVIIHEQSDQYKDAYKRIKTLIEQQGFENNAAAWYMLATLANKLEVSADTYFHYLANAYDINRNILTIKIDYMNAAWEAKIWDKYLAMVNILRNELNISPNDKELNEKISAAQKALLDSIEVPEVEDPYSNYPLLQN